MRRDRCKWAINLRNYIENQCASLYRERETERAPRVLIKVLFPFCQRELLSAILNLELERASLVERDDSRGERVQIFSTFRRMHRRERRNDGDTLKSSDSRYREFCREFVRGIRETRDSDSVRSITRGSRDSNSSLGDSVTETFEIKVREREERKKTRARVDLNAVIAGTLSSDRPVFINGNLSERTTGRR